MSPAMRTEVADSWHRSAAAGVSPHAQDTLVTLEAQELPAYREAHVLSRVFPLLDDVLGQAARDCDAVMAVSDAQGALLWVCGNPATLRAAERIGFVEGSNWDETAAGTNAPGLTLRLDRPTTVTRDEHFRAAVHPWSCVAAPIHDPRNGSILGVLDITGGDEIAVPQTMAMVRATARMAEAELARDLLRSAPPTASSFTGLRLAIETLGRREALVTVHDGRGKASELRLSPRHSDIVVLLSRSSTGLSGDELAVLLYDDDTGESTTRAELGRLRRLLGDDLLTSRPYRLAAGIDADWARVEALLAAGDVRGAVAAYRGPLLPRSISPGIAGLRDALTEAIRQAVLRSGQGDLMSAWTRSVWGADDYQMWQAQRATLSPSSPLRALVDGHLARLDRALG